MPNQIGSNSPNQNIYHLAVIFLLYTVFALLFGLAYRFAINPDGTSMLRLAGYIAEGRFLHSVSPGYSPLFTWLIAPLIFLGLDGQTAARITIALCGASLLLFSWLLTVRFDLSPNIRLTALLIAALLISFWTIQFISPDVLFASLTLCYIYLLTDPNILTRKKTAFLCGAAGGFTYLAHHYALPFFFAHFPLLLLTRGHMDRDNAGIPWKKILISLSTGIAGFLLISSIWIGIVTVKNGRFTISTKGGAAHAIMGPKDVDRRHPFFVGGLFKPKDAYAIHVFEDPSDVDFKTWSPFESKAYFIHQLNVIKINLVYLLNHFVNNSPFFTYAFVIGVLVLVPVALCLNSLNKTKRFLYTWTVVTFIIYCSGFILVIARSPRRFYALMIIFLFLSFHFMEELLNALRAIVPERNKKLLAFYLTIIVCAAFAIKPSVNLIKSVKHISTADQVNPYKEIAEQISNIEFPAPYAIIRSSQKLTTDYYLAYFLNKQLLGRPKSDDVDGITEELKTAGGRSLMVFDNPEITDKLKLDTRYLIKGSVKVNGEKKYEHVVPWIITADEIITGWDKEVNIFTLK